MPDQIDTTGMMLGEMKGQLRELIHNVNSMAAKIDSLTEWRGGAAGLPAKIKDLEERVAKLEADKNRREGAMGFGNWLMKSPIAAWIIAVAFALWSMLKGKT